MAATILNATATVAMLQRSRAGHLSSLLDFLLFLLLLFFPFFSPLLFLCPLFLLLLFSFFLRFLSPANVHTYCPHKPGLCQAIVNRREKQTRVVYVKKGDSLLDSDDDDEDEDDEDELRDMLFSLSSALFAAAAASEVRAHAMYIALVL